MSKPIPIDHEMDVAWILAVWRAIHGGDPAWQKTALEVIAALTATLAGDARPSGNAVEIVNKLREIGVNLEVPKLKKDSITRVAEPNDRTYCITYQHKRECVTLHGPPPWKGIQSS